MIYVHSNIIIPELMAYLPTAEIYAQKGEGMPDKPPFLLVVISDNDAVSLGVIQDLEAQGIGVVALPHPRSPKPLSGAHHDAVKAYAELEPGHTMADLLAHVHEKVPSAHFDPNLHCY